MSSDELVVERGRVAVIRINRPRVRNALHSGLVAKLAEAVTGLADDGGVRAIVLTGTGATAFSAGADLNELTGLGNTAATRVLGAGQAAFRAVEQSEVPVIAAVNGLALGGGFELVLACSVPVLAEQASLGLPETGLGLIPGYGGTQRLARVVGPAVARFVALTGRRINADEAYQWGITPVPPVPGDQLLGYAIQLATEIADRGPRAAAKVLRLVDLAADQTLDGGLSMETRFAADAVSSAEGAEGIRAFTARETPKFESRR